MNNREAAARFPPVRRHLQLQNVRPDRKRDRRRRPRGSLHAILSPDVAHDGPVDVAAAGAVERDILQAVHISIGNVLLGAGVSYRILIVVPQG